MSLIFTGKFQFQEMKEANILVPVMFFVFVLCTSWVLINLLLTIIIKSFEQVNISETDTKLR